MNVNKKYKPKNALQKPKCFRSELVMVSVNPMKMNQCNQSDVASMNGSVMFLASFP
jgi:hypothetical protein